MAEERRGMGRGLAAILPRTQKEDGAGLRELPVEIVKPNPRQPRRASTTRRWQSSPSRSARAESSSRSWSGRCPAGSTSSWR